MTGLLGVLVYSSSLEALNFLLVVSDIAAVANAMTENFRRFQRT